MWNPHVANKPLRFLRVAGWTGKGRVTVATTRGNHRDLPKKGQPLPSLNPRHSLCLDRQVLNPRPTTTATTTIQTRQETTILRTLSTPTTQPGSLSADSLVVVPPSLKPPTHSGLNLPPASRATAAKTQEEKQEGSSIPREAQTRPENRTIDPCFTPMART